MPDFRVADTAPEHPKLRVAGLAAAGLWSLAGAWSMRELTDGWVPEYWTHGWPQGPRNAAVLVEVGLWQPEERHGLPGYRFRDWTDYQRPADKIREERSKAADRAAKSRARAAERNGARSNATSRDTRSTTHTAAQPHATRESHDSLPLPLPPGGPGGRKSHLPRARTRSPPPPTAPRDAPTTPRSPPTSPSRPAAPAATCGNSTPTGPSPTSPPKPTAAAPTPKPDEPRSTPAPAATSKDGATPAPD